MRVKKRNVVVFGFALFAMFFGAGNVIFPPFLGFQTSPDWLPAIIGFLITDVILATFSIIVMAKNDDGIACITGRIGRLPSEVLNIVIILCMGPAIAIPRTAAASFDLLMVPVFGFEVGTWVQIVFTLVFFVITWCLVIKPTKIYDIVGKVLTPLLLLSLVILTIKGIMSPIGPQAIAPKVTSPIGEGFLSGYQAMDLFGALSFGSLMITTAKTKGYKSRKYRVRLLFLSSGICFALLCTTSIALAYLGSTASYEFGDVTSQASLIANIGTQLISFGGILIGVLASLACLTTSIGLSSGTAIFFKRFIKEPSKGKNNNVYEVLVTITVCVSFAIANASFESIVAFAGPILLCVFPMVVVLVILAWFNDKIKSDRVYKCTAFTALISNVFIVICHTAEFDFINYLPLVNMNLGWLLPTLIGLGIGFIVGRGHDDRHKLKIFHQEDDHEKNQEDNHKDSHKESKPDKQK